MRDERLLTITANCTGCGACAELQPDYIGWDEGESRPLLLTDVAPDAVVYELQAFCPEDCFDYEL